jgi:hypothetical protein
MPGPWDASIKLLYPVDQNGFTTIDDLTNGSTFDAIANVEIGEDLNENVDDFVLRVGVLNLTTSQTIQIKEKKGKLTPQDDTTFLAEERVSLNPPAQTPGDVLKLVASYRVNAGSNSDTSSAESVTFTVV